MTTSSRRRLQALERRHVSRSPCPSCPPERITYQHDDGRPCGRFGLPLQEDQAALPGPASCPACCLPARVLAITYMRNWRDFRPASR